MVKAAIVSVKGHQLRLKHTEKKSTLKIYTTHKLQHINL